MAARHPLGTIPQLKAEARRSVRRGAVERYRSLWAEAAAISGEAERYVARRTLLDAVLELGSTAPAATVPALLSTAAQATTAVLEEEPREPVLLNQLGVLLSLLEQLDAAEALFEAALRLDPQLPNAARNLTEVVSVRGALAARRPAAPSPLATRAARVAAEARPATGKTLSLCMIVKDEEEMLPRCLAAAAPAVDEIVIVDTGSSDRTVEIAESFGARVIDFPWTGSFAEARNVSLDAATGDWLFVLDADEVLVADDVPRLRALLGETWREAFYITEINYTGQLDDGTATTHSALRVFKARPDYRYEGRLHEQILHRIPGIPERIAAVPVRIEHFGYLGAVRDAKEKSRRNIELLERQREEGDDSAFLHFNLGSEHAATGDAEAALAEFERTAELLETDPEQANAGYLPAFTSRHVRALRICGRPEEAIARADAALERLPGFTDLVLEQGAAARALGRVEEAIAYYERCIEMGDAPAGYTATVGSGTYLPAIELAELFSGQGEVDRAVRLLDATLADHPGFFGLVHPFATALLKQGASSEEVVARVERHVRSLTPTMRFMLGTALYEAGETGAAELQFRLLLERQPDSAQARVALAEALLSQSRWEEAATVAAAVGDDEPHAAAARRSELFARIAGGDHDGAAAVLARAEATAGDDEQPAAEAVLEPAERELFAAWLRAARGEPDERPLPLAAVPLLTVTLEALLRVEEVDLFATLVPLVERSPLDEREQRELRAGVYLRRGYLASAAEEWLAVAGTRPDARALVGLAQVAVGQGMTEEALEFAREAAALDPDHRDAALVLARLEPLAA